jgi:hypothetical protein
MTEKHTFAKGCFQVEWFKQSGVRISAISPKAQHQKDDENQNCGNNLSKT